MVEYLSIINGKKLVNPMNARDQIISSLEPYFIEWACSPSGCDGGNVTAKIWVSGIEPGLKKEKGYKPNNYYEELKNEILKGKFTPESTFNWENSLKYTYGISFAKLFTVIKGERISDYERFVKKRSELEIFKLNLYPIAFNNTDHKLWNEFELEKITGFKAKELFKTWCFLHRFPAISELVIKNEPKLIICTGISYLTDFFACFAGGKNIASPIYCDEIPPDKNAKIQQARKYCWAQINEKTKLVVIPFFFWQLWIE